MVTLLCCMLIAVGLVIGAVSSAIWFNSAAQKAKSEWRQKRKDLEMQIFQLKQQLETERQLRAAANEAPAFCECQDETPETSGRQDPPVRENRPAISDKATRTTSRPQEMVREPAGKTLDQTYAEFAACEALSVEFQPSFPDSLLFRPGTGYIRSLRNELLPDHGNISQINTAAGYAMDGMFRIFDVIYQGKEYSFSQIQTGAMGNAYVKIRSILACAKIRETGQPGIYMLEQKGKLEVTDA